MRSVGGDGGEKRLLSRRLGLDPLERLPEEEVRAIALGLLERAIVEQGRIEVAVVRGVPTGTGVGLADPAAAVDVHLVEAAAVGPILGFVSQVPLAEDAGRVAARPKHLGDRRCRQRQSLPLVDRVSDTVCKLMPSGHQGGSGGRAGGAYEKVGEPQALRLETVEVRRLEHRVAMRREVAVALVVGEHQHDVRTQAGQRRRLSRSGLDDVAGEETPRMLRERSPSRLPPPPACGHRPQAPGHPRRGGSPGRRGWSHRRCGT